MQKIVQELERNVHSVEYGSVSVELRIHEGQVVKTIYRTETTNVQRNISLGKDEEDNNDRQGN